MKLLDFNYIILELWHGKRDFELANQMEWSDMEVCSYWLGFCGKMCYEFWATSFSMRSHFDQFMHDLINNWLPSLNSLPWTPQIFSIVFSTFHINHRSKEKLVLRAQHTKHMQPSINVFLQWWIVSYYTSIKIQHMYILVLHIHFPYESG